MREDVELYRQTLDTYLHAGITVIGVDTAARVMAVLMVFGNNEGFTMNGKFNVEREYIQERYGLRAGEVPDAEFIRRLKYYAADLEAYSAANRPGPMVEVMAPWGAKLLKERYNIKPLAQ